MELPGSPGQVRVASRVGSLIVRLGVEGKKSELVYLLGGSGV